MRGNNLSSYELIPSKPINGQIDATKPLDILFTGNS